jgi:hypothetical protein
LEFREVVVPRNLNLRWHLVSQTIFDICLAFASLRLPNYVVLEIIDWFPHYCDLNRFRKVTLIEKINKSFAVKYGDEFADEVLE